MDELQRYRLLRNDEDNHDCQLPFGTLSAAITSPGQESFTITPNITGSVTTATVEAGMIVVMDDEENLVHRFERQHLHGQPAWMGRD